MGPSQARMQKTLRHLAEQLGGIRPGPLGAGLAATIRVAVGGQMVPLGKLAAVGKQGDRLIVRPFDPGHVPAIVAALSEAAWSAYAIDPRTVAVAVPPLSGEQRAAIARRIKALGEEARVALRMIRQESRQHFAATGRKMPRSVQEATDAAVAEVDRMIRAKLDELGGGE